MAKGQLKRVWFDVTEDGVFGLMPEAGPPYVYKPFPCARYHPTLPPRIVKTQAGLDKLGKEWSDKPIQAKDHDHREPVDDD